MVKFAELPKCQRCLFCMICLHLQMCISRKILYIKLLKYLTVSWFTKMNVFAKCRHLIVHHSVNPWVCWGRTIVITPMAFLPLWFLSIWHSCEPDLQCYIGVLWMLNVQRLHVKANIVNLVCCCCKMFVLLHIFDLGVKENKCTSVTWTLYFPAINKSCQMNIYLIYCVSYILYSICP